MSTYYTVFLQVKVKENITIKQYIKLERMVKSKIRSANSMIRFIDIQPL